MLSNFLQNFDTINLQWLVLTAVLLLIILYLFIRNRLLSNTIRTGRTTMEQTILNIENAPLPIIIFSMDSEKILFANSTSVLAFGLNRENLTDYKLQDFFADTSVFHNIKKMVRQNKHVSNLEISVTPFNQDSSLWMLASFHEIIYKNQKLLYAVYQDINILKQAELMMKEQTEHDPLTSIYNRRYFYKTATEIMIQARKTKEPYALLMFDIDHFKSVNDTYGHKAGDKLIIDLANICMQTFDKKDIVARYGGDEFIVFLPNTTPKAAMAAAERLRTNIKKLSVMADDNQSISVTISLSAATSDLSNNLDILMQMADKALYCSKNNGRNQATLYDAATMGAISQE